MKMSSVAAVTVITVMSWIVLLQGAEAQGTVTCLSVPGHGASVLQANAMVQYMRGFLPPVTACTASNVVQCESWWGGVGGWDVAGTICAGPNYCLFYEDFGNYLNEVLAQCVDQNNEVQGFYQLNEGQTFYLTSATCMPNCANSSR